LHETKGFNPQSRQSIQSAYSTQIYLVGSQNGQHNGQHDRRRSRHHRTRSCRSGFHNTLNIANAEEQDGFGSEILVVTLEED
jgi:hypothetical protein